MPPGPGRYDRKTGFGNVGLQKSFGGPDNYE
jgi:hypothetical protein